MGGGGGLVEARQGTFRSAVAVTRPVATAPRGGTGAPSDAPRRQLERGDSEVDPLCLGGGLSSESD